MKDKSKTKSAFVIIFAKGKCSNTECKHCPLINEYCFMLSQTEPSLIGRKRRCDTRLCKNCPFVCEEQNSKHEPSQKRIEQATQWLIQTYGEQEAKELIRIETLTKEEKQKLYLKNYRDAHKESIQKKNKEYFKKNKEYFTNYQKEYYKKNKEYFDKYYKEQRQANKEKVAESRKKYYEKQRLW